MSFTEYHEMIDIFAKCYSVKPNEKIPAAKANKKKTLTLSRQVLANNK